MNESEERLKLLLYLLKNFDDWNFPAADLNDSIDVNQIYREVKRKIRVEKLNKINKNF